MLVGYARTSTSDQTAGLDAQQRDLTAAGCERVFCEQVSSVSARAKLVECLSFLRQGDVLTVTKPDRLAQHGVVDESSADHAAFPKVSVSVRTLSQLRTTKPCRSNRLRMRLASQPTMSSRIGASTLSASSLSSVRVAICVR